MKTILICPDNRRDIGFLSRLTPLALTPVFGQPLLTHALTHLAERGATHVTILAADRPDQIRDSIGKGERWGLQVTVLAENREISVQEARTRFRTTDESGWLGDGLDVVILNHPLGDPHLSMFGSYTDFFAHQKELLMRFGKSRIGARAIAPGIWAGMRCRVASDAKLTAPCWLGEGSWIRSGAKVGTERVSGRLLAHRP